MSAPTLKTIAELAGVSRMTVSRVLRNDRAISVATAEKVRAIAEQIGYRPNPLIAAHMAQLRAAHPPRQRPFIAFLTAGTNENSWRKNFLGHVFNGAEDRATERGYGLSPIWISQPKMTWHRLDQVLLARGVHGLIIGTLRPLSHLRLIWDRYAVATLGYTLARPDFHRVASNHSQTLSLVLRLLRHRGYRRIGLVIRRRTDQQTNHAILGSYLGWQFLQEPEHRIDPCYLEGFDEKAFDGWLEATCPDAILITEPVMHQWLRKRRIQIPEAMGVVQVFSDTVIPGLAHIRRDYVSIGSALVDLVIDQLQRNERGIPDVPKVVSVDTTWEEGASLLPMKREKA